MTDGSARRATPAREQLVQGGAAAGGALFASLGAALVVSAIHRSDGPHDYSPLAILFVALTLGGGGVVLGGAVGLVVHTWWARQPLRRAVLPLLVLVVFVGLSAWAAVLVLPALAVDRVVVRVRQMAEPALGQLLEDPRLGQDLDVLAAIAVNPRSSPATLDKVLALNSPALFERRSSLVEAMRNGEGTPVAQLVAKNPSTSAATLERLCGRLDVRRIAAANPGVSDQLLDRLARDPDSMVRFGAAVNPRLPPRIRTQLQRDPDSLVRRAALGEFDRGR